MKPIHLKRPVKIAIGCFGLLIGLTAAVRIYVQQNGLEVLIPFALAMIVSGGASWWAQRHNDSPAHFPPLGAGKDRARSSDELSCTR